MAWVDCTGCIGFFPHSLDGLIDCWTAPPLLLCVGILSCVFYIYIFMYIKITFLFFRYCQCSLF